MRALDVAGTRILLVNLDGAFYGVSGVCTHEEADLGEGTLDGYNVVCPFHGSEFDLRSGEVQNPPADRPLRTHVVKVEDGSVFVEI